MKLQIKLQTAAGTLFCIRPWGLFFIPRRHLVAAVMLTNNFLLSLSSAAISCSDETNSWSHPSDGRSLYWRHFRGPSQFGPAAAESQLHLQGIDFGTAGTKRWFFFCCCCGCRWRQHATFESTQQLHQLPPPLALILSICLSIYFKWVIKATAPFLRCHQPPTL